MGSFFEIPQLRQFDMKTRYYSEEKEHLDELKRRVGEDVASEEERAERMRDAYARRRSLRKKPNKVLSVSRVLIYVLLVIVLVMLIGNARWLLF